VAAPISHFTFEFLTFCARMFEFLTLRLNFSLFGRACLNFSLLGLNFSLSCARANFSLLWDRISHSSGAAGLTRMPRSRHAIDTPRMSKKEHGKHHDGGNNLHSFIAIVATTFIHSFPLWQQPSFIHSLPITQQH
jgi:hypothetical protein